MIAVRTRARWGARTCSPPRERVRCCNKAALATAHWAGDVLLAQAAGSPLSNAGHWFAVKTNKQRRSLICCVFGLLP